ncbi:MAG: hypothetical protein AB7U85_02365 [Alphaproteobacteria bacterium]
MSSVSSTTEVGPSAWEARSAPKLWEKSVTDVSDAKESYSEARDIGTARLDYNRLNVIAELSENDSVDYYKFSTSSRGNLRISLRDSDAEDEEDPLDIDVNDYLKAAGIEVEEDSTDETLSDLEEIIDDLTAKNIKLQLYTVKNGKETLVADSTADEDSDEYAAFEALSEGEYRIDSTETFYVKISRIDESEDSDAYQYALQVQLGTEYDSNLLTTEKEADESTDYEGKAGAYISSEGQAAVDALSTYGVYNLSEEAETALSTAISNGYTSTYVAGQSAVTILNSASSSSSSSAVSILQDGSSSSTIDLFS